MLSSSSAWGRLYYFHTINSQTSFETSPAGSFFFPIIYIFLIPFFGEQLVQLNILSLKVTSFQHKEFEEIEARVQRHEPLILGSSAAQRLSRRLPVEVISDPLNAVEKDPYEEELHKQLKGHQIFLSF